MIARIWCACAARSILELDARRFPAVGLGEDYRIESAEITGGALAQNGRVIHLAAFQTDPERKA
jgi:hypothetical protein